MDRIEPTMDDITEKEVLIEIYNEIKAIKRFLYWPVYLLIGYAVLSLVALFTT